MRCSLRGWNGNNWNAAFTLSYLLVQITESKSYGMGAIWLSIVELHSASYTLENSLGTIYTIRKKENVDVSQIEMSEEP